MPSPLVSPPTESSFTDVNTTGLVAGAAATGASNLARDKISRPTVTDAPLPAERSITSDPDTANSPQLVFFTTVPAAIVSVTPVGTFTQSAIYIVPFALDHDVFWDTAPDTFDSTHTFWPALTRVVVS